MPPAPQFIAIRAERAFSLIEVIIAMTILSIVLSGAAVAVVSSDSVEVRSKAVADTHAIGERAVERLRTDLTARSYCDRQSWIATARTWKERNLASEADFRPCQRDYTDLRDAKGRRYLVSLTVEPKDRPDDGYGVRDTDGDLRDAYEVETVVDLAGDSKAGRESLPPIRLGGSIDWEGGSADDAQVRVVACAIDRPDRALIGGGCTSSDARSRQAITVRVGVSKVNEETGGTSHAGTITSGSTPVTLAPGAYRFVAPRDVSSGGVTFKLLKLDPGDLRVYGSQSYVIHATYVRSAMRTEVCTQIANWRAPNDDGYEVLKTNMHWRRSQQAGYRSLQLNLRGDGNPRRGFQASANGRNRAWDCRHVLIDPVQADQACPSNGYGMNATLRQLCPSLYRGVYDLEVEEVDRRRSPVGNYRLYVMGGSNSPSLNCNLSSWNRPMGGTRLLAPGTDTQNRRPRSPDYNNASWYGRVAINATSGTQRICFRFYSKQFERERCSPTYPYRIAMTGTRSDGTTYTYYVTDYSRPVYPSPCFYSGTTCRLPSGVDDDDSNCWNGAEVCVANCDAADSSGPAGSAGPVSMTTQSGGVTGGPNDPTVGCTTQPGYTWAGSRLYGASMSTLQPMSRILAHTWVGGDSYYYANFSGRTMARKSHPYGVHPDAFTYNLPDNPVFHCTDVYFTAPGNMLQGSWKLYTCLEVTVPGRAGYKIRGRILDQSGVSGSTLYTTVGGALGLAPDAAKMTNHWNPFGGSASYPLATTGNAYSWPDYQVRRVSGDPVCNSGSNEPVYEHRDPIIEEVWEKVVDDPWTYPLRAPRVFTNLGWDKAGV